MAKFKQVSQRFICRQAVVAFRNMVNNFEASVADDDFFRIVDVSMDHDAALELVKDSYTDRELSELRNAPMRHARLDFEASLKDIFRVLWNTGAARDKCKGILNGICEYTIRDMGADDGDDTARARLAALRKTFRLTSLEAAIVTLTYVVNETCFQWPSRCSVRQRPLLYAMALDRSLAEVSAALSGKGRLRRFGLIDERFCFNEAAFGGFMDGTEADAVSRRFYRKCEVEDALPWEYYGALADGHGDTIKRMISAGGPCNILLYGAPGTGKTSFAHAIVRESGRVGFEIPQGDADGGNGRVDARMAGIQVCNEQEAPEESVVVVDEADELLRSGPGALSPSGMPAPGGRGMEKGVVGSMLDEVRIPTIWISGAPAEAMDESVRRRFDYSVRFTRLNRTQRASIWRNIVARTGMQSRIDDEKIRRYAERYETSAGGIATVLANVKRLDRGLEPVDGLVARLMAPHCELMGIPAARSDMPSGDYSLEGLNIGGDVPIGGIEAAVRNFIRGGSGETSFDSPRMNILLWGPPGTGKTEYVKYLGKAVDRRVVVKTGGDLLSKWVGETERNIARAFDEAESDGAILFFDEVDGLVRDRSGAHRSWEVTRVAELLHRMENFTGIMVAATNFVDSLDAAIMRRFTFKLQFDYLGNSGKRVFFERMFGTRLGAGEKRRLDRIPGLTPGDFRTARQKLHYLAGEAGNAERLAALESEARAKTRGRCAKIGF